MKTILITGFEPFGGDAFNPSQAIACALHGRVIAGRRIVGATLPCEFGGSVTELKRLLRRHRPTLAVCLGVAGGRAEITPERIAINVDDARIPDNLGAQPIDRPVVRGGPTAYFSTLPIKSIVAALCARGVPAAVSSTAGTFVCNHVFYGLMHALRRMPGVRAGLVHVPCATEHTRSGEPSLPLATMIDAVALAVEMVVKNRRDLRHAGGQTH